MSSSRQFHHLHEDVQPPAKADFAAFASRRSVVYSGRGMIACSEPLAAEAGLEILRKGGNAADAAVAVAGMLNLVEPVMCGIGGDAFCLYFDAKTKTVKGLNGSGRSPKALTLAKAREMGIKGNLIPRENLNCVTVPGAPAAWIDTIEAYGSGKITIADALDPAIRAAEAGAPISELSARMWQDSYDLLMSASDNSAEMLIADPETGKLHSPRAGERFKNPGLAKTFREVAEKGKDGFYKGRIAEAIVELVQSKGGVMTLEDLASHKTEHIEPISYAYGGEGGVTLHECPPNGQGIVALIALGIVDALEESGAVDLRAAGHNSVIWLHTLIEAIRLAFADARAYVADPIAMRVPVEKLLSKEYLKSRAALIKPDSAIPNFAAGNPIASTDTVQFATADEEGNACSYIFSNYAGVGTGAVPKGCGFTLQNRGENFNLTEGHPNCIDGGKRPYHTIIPGMVTKGDKPGGDIFMAYGVMGGFNQPQGHLQVLLNMLQHGFNAQTALDAPRFCISAESDDGSDDVNAVVWIEEGVDDDVVKELIEMGHKVKVIKDHARQVFGRGQIVQRLKGDVWAGGSDPRTDGHAVPQI